jgi:hypothetical protein
MQWDKFAVQVEDPQQNVFQLGFVNLPSAEIPGVEGDIAFTLSEEWQIDGAFSWNDAQVSEATTLSVTNEDGETFSFQVKDGARLPLTPIGRPRLASSIGQRRGGSTRSRSRASITRTWANRSIRWRASSRSSRARRHRRRTRTRPGTCASGSRPSGGALALRQQHLERVRHALHRQPVGVATPAGFGGWQGGQRLSVLQPLTFGLTLRYNF